MGKKQDLIRKLREFKGSIGKDMTVEKLILFGSHASGKTHKWSDIDLLIVSEIFREMDYFERGAKMYDYWTLKKPVDFICLTPEEFRKKSKEVSIVSEALKEGIEI